MTRPGEFMGKHNADALNTAATEIGEKDGDPST
jgi:hypothetical protein